MRPAVSILWGVLAALGLAVSTPAHAEQEIRPSAVAGSWYPEERSVAAAQVAQMISDARGAPSLSQKPIALVVPHAGWRFSGVAAAAAFRNLHRGDFSRVVLVGPSHHEGFPGFVTSSVRAYRTPLGDVEIDRAAVEALLDGQLVRQLPEAENPEYSLEIEVPFLQMTLGSFRLVPVIAGDSTFEQEQALGSKLAAMDDGKTLFVFSTDFTHYGPLFGYVPFGSSAPAAREKIRERNAKAVDLLSRKDARAFRAYLDETGDTICGRHGLGVMLALLSKIARGASPVVLARYASIDLPGFQDDNSVSYVAMAFVPGKPVESKPLEAIPARAICPPHPAPLGESLERQVVDLARAALRTQLRGTNDLELALSALPPGRAELDRLQGVFVTLQRNDPAEIEREGKLRGCIGQVFPAFPLRLAVVVAAVSAALHDTRFPPVEAGELDRLDVEVTLLSPPEPVGSWKDIRLGTHGIVLEKGEHRALFLPQVPGEQGWTLDETLSHLSVKAGLPADAWKQGTRFSVFTGQVLHERRATQGEPERRP
jgi:hypothetical protein